MGGPEAVFVFKRVDPQGFSPARPVKSRGLVRMRLTDAAGSTSGKIFKNGGCVRYRTGLFSSSARR